MTPRRNTVLPGGGGFHHVAIKVHDYERAVAFYKALGFTEKLDWGEKTATADNRGILLDAGDGNYMEIFAGGPANATYHPWGEDAALKHVAFRTSDLEHALQVAAAAGATITMQPKDIVMGRPGKSVNIRVAFVQAPTGEVVEFFTCPPDQL